jgi:hypothetical protein
MRVLAGPSERAAYGGSDGGDVRFSRRTPTATTATTAPQAGRKAREHNSREEAPCVHHHHSAAVSFALFALVLPSGLVGFGRCRFPDRMLDARIRITEPCVGSFFSTTRPVQAGPRDGFARRFLEHSGKPEGHAHMAQPSTKGRRAQTDPLPASVSRGRVPDQAHDHQQDSRNDQHPSADADQVVDGIE